MDKEEKEEKVVKQHSKNFKTLTRAFKGNNVALMECTEKATGEKVAVICTVHVDKDKQYNFTPFAKFFNGNPYDLLTPPE